MSDPAPDTRLLNLAPSGLGRDAFVARYGGLYEHSPWIAERAWANRLTARHDTVDGLAAALAAIVDAADTEAQLDLINAHPDLGGKAAMRGELTNDSTKEQAGAGLDQCTPEEYERLQTLNHAYRGRFGFVFVLAVRGLDRHDILATMAQRLRHDADTERRTAIAEIHQIARLRLSTFADD